MDQLRPGEGIRLEVVVLENPQKGREANQKRELPKRFGVSLLPFLLDPWGVVNGTANPAAT